jgi:hypothetical protein
MYLKASYPIDQLRDYSSLFSRNEAKRWLNNDFSVLNHRIEQYDNSLLKKDISYLKYLKYIYRVVRRDYPFEYIYKNEFINQWVKNELGNSNSIVFNEFKIGKATADLALFNGTSKVFEIKTIFDSEYRLSHQLNEYKKLFNEIYLIVPECQASKYLHGNDKVGIITYSSLTNSFRLVRKSHFQKCPNFSIIMKVLHTKEYKDIVFEFYGKLPKMNDFTQFDVCKELIFKIPPMELNKLFVKTLKRRKINNHFFNKLNSEFNQICLSLNLTENEKEKLIYKLDTKIKLPCIILS